MIIDLGELRLHNRPFEVVREFAEEDLQINSAVSSLKRPVETRLRVILSGERVKVEGKLRAELALICCRCATETPFLIEKDFQLDYLPDPEDVGDGEEFELTYDDLDVGFYRNDEIDLSVVLSEQIVLEMPMKPVCREDCKGLCDQCGADLNEAPCKCEKTSLDPRLSALSELKKRMIH